MNRQVTLGRPWTAEEDEKLINAVQKHGDNTEKWKVIASTVPGRTNKACRKRWLHSLCPTVKKCAWSPEEDQLLLSLFEKHPNKWSQIARGIAGRTDDACSKRYREALDPKLKKGEWTVEEDFCLLGALGRQEDPLHPKWGGIGQELQRSGLACRNRWRLLERKRNMEGRKALLCSSTQGDHAPLSSHNFTDDWSELGGTTLWNSQWDFSQLNHSDFTNIDQALGNFVRQHDAAGSSGSSSVRTAADDQTMTFEPLSDAWMSGVQPTDAIQPPMQSHDNDFSHSVPHQHQRFDVDASIDPRLSEYVQGPPVASSASVDPGQVYDSPPADFDMDCMQFHALPHEQIQSNLEATEDQMSLMRTQSKELPQVSIVQPESSGLDGLTRLGALAAAASALSHSPIGADGPADADKALSKKRKRNSADAAVTTSFSVIELGPQKPLPKLSSSLPVAGDPTILAYACGHSACWPSLSAYSSTRYATSGELLSHFKDFHMNRPGNADETPFKCGLQGCTRGWKSINGLQYHLQIARAHYQAVMSMVTSDVAGPSVSSPSVSPNQDGPKSEKTHKCPHPTCPKEYKQISGLRYHLLHGHPKSVPVQLEILPPSMVKKLGLESRSQALQA